MPELIILIAEDDENAITTWELDIREFNRANAGNIQFSAEYARNRREALQKLDRLRIDCAVADLRMPSDERGADGAAAPMGNDILEQVLTEVGIPAVVYSGYPQEASQRVVASQIRVLPKKLGGGMEILNLLASFEPLMSAMGTARRRMAKECTGLFVGSIWPRWEKYWVGDNPELLSAVITRQMVAHAAEQLGLPPNSHHPEEFYIIPPLVVDRLNTGDLLRVESKEFVVVTPRCNMARDKYPEHLMLAWCDPMEKVAPDLARRLASAKTREKAEKELHGYATQSHSVSTHFIPPCGDTGPWLVDFRQPRSISSDQVVALIASRFASIAPQFIPNLIQRFSAYLGRIGQPELDQTALRERIIGPRVPPQ
jgi:hypothetical protein